MIFYWTGCQSGAGSELDLGRNIKGSSLLMWEENALQEIDAIDQQPDNGQNLEEETIDANLQIIMVNYFSRKG